jgi:hypothetical protein
MLSFFSSLLNDRDPAVIKKKDGVNVETNCANFMVESTHYC